MIVISSHAQLNKLVAQVRDEVFNRLKPEDYQYLLQSSRLLSLRNVNPSRCTGEANIVFHDPTVPRCWRARAGVYRAEALMALGFSKLAKDQLILTGRLLESEDYPQQIDLMDRKRYEILEALVAWNIALGKISSVFPSFFLPSYLLIFQVPDDIVHAQHENMTNESK